MTEALRKRHEEYQADYADWPDDLFPRGRVHALLIDTIAALRAAEAVAEELEKDKAALTAALRDGAKAAMALAGPACGLLDHIRNSGYVCANGLPTALGRQHPGLCEGYRRVRPLADAFRAASSAEGKP